MMVEHLSGFMMVICDRWIDEVRGERCVLADGHDGPCSASHKAAARGE